MSLLFQLGLNGLSIGCTYAVIAMSFGLIYSTTRTFHVAHGTVYVSSAYLGYYLIQLRGWSPIIVLFLCLLWSAILGMMIYYFFYKPLYKQGASPMVVFITSLAIAIIGENVLTLIFGPDPKQFTPSILTSPLKIHSYIFSYLDGLSIISAIIIFIVLMLYLNHTGSGKAIKAVASDPELAECIGIRTDRIYLQTYALGSLLATPAGLLVGVRGSLTPGMGSDLTLIAVMAVILGGIGNAKGAFLVCVFLGLIRNMSLIYIDSSWQSTLTFGIFLLLIILKPTGLFGERSNLK